MMTIDTIIKELQSHFAYKNLSIEESSENEGDIIVLFTPFQKQMTINGHVALSKMKSKSKAALDEYVYIIEKWMEAIEPASELSLLQILPVIRSASSPVKNNQGEEYLTFHHTAETRIYLARDLGESYRLLLKGEVEGVSDEELLELSLENLRKKPIAPKIQEVAGNVFCFFRSHDGFEASRILLQEVYGNLAEGGPLLIGVPHQDVLICANVHNDAGYEMMSRMNMQFFTEGRTPITPMVFEFDGKDVTPIWIHSAKNSH